MNEANTSQIQDPSTYIQANVGGRLCDAREPTVSPLDRGFLYGDAVYEVWRTYNGVIFAWEEHWERLRATTEGISMNLECAPDQMLEEIRRTVKAWRGATGLSGDVYVRLQISRGAGPIGLNTDLAINQSFAIFVKLQPDLTNENLNRGMNLSICRNWRRNPLDALPPSLKTGNYLNNILGLTEARERGADDVLFLNREGTITEASTRNVWFVFKDRIVTPRLSDGLLAGVTRRLLLEKIVAFEGRPLVEESVCMSDIRDAEECFLTSTTQDLQPVASIDDKGFKVGKDTIGRQLKNHFGNLVRDYVMRNPELRLN